mgnify:CR=1 FL=1
MSILFEVAANYRALAEKLHDTDLDDKTIEDTLESESGDLVEKLTNVGFVIRNIDAEVSAMKDAEEKIAARRKSKENRIARLKAYALANMLATGKTKIESPYFVMGLRNNPESVVIAADAVIPAEFMREPPPPKAHAAPPRGAPTPPPERS